jgi:hypothetical protein
MSIDEFYRCQCPDAPAPNAPRLRFSSRTLSVKLKLHQTLTALESIFFHRKAIAATAELTNKAVMLLQEFRLPQLHPEFLNLIPKPTDNWSYSKSVPL